MGKKWITIYTFFDILEGQKLESILRDNNIPTNLISRQDSAFGGLNIHQSIRLNSRFKKDMKGKFITFGGSEG